MVGRLVFNRAPDSRGSLRLKYMQHNRPAKCDASRSIQGVFLEERTHADDWIDIPEPPLLQRAEETSLERLLVSTLPQQKSTTEGPQSNETLEYLSAHFYNLSSV